MSVPGKYFMTDLELDRNSNTDDNIDLNTHDLKKKNAAYSYDEALELVGSGWYVYALVAFLILSFQGMALDMFGTAVVLIGACDMNLNHSQKSILLSLPLLGSLVMAWPWDCLANTQGRRKALMFSLCGSSLLSLTSAFSPNWVILAVLKFGSCSFSSGIQSLGLKLLGETCSPKLKAKFMGLANGSLLMTFAVYTVTGFVILDLNFSVDLNIIRFTNWRLLIVVFALPNILSAIMLSLFYESPKFLVHRGHNKEAVKVLRNIHRRNGGKTKYPVKEIVLNELTYIKETHLSLYWTLKDQVLPLFRPPLLYRSIQLLYITANVYATNNGFFVWNPLIVDTFYAGYYQNVTAGGICDMIVNSKMLDTDSVSCAATVKELPLWISLTQASLYTIAYTGVSWLPRWKKSVIISLLCITFVSGIMIPVMVNKIASIILFNCFMINSLCISMLFSYYEDLFPTVHCFTATCLGIVVARFSAIIGSNLVGSYIASHCSTSFYAWSMFVLSGIVACWFLPADTSKIQH